MTEQRQILFLEAPPTRPNHLPKAPPPTVITLGIRISSLIKFINFFFFLVALDLCRCGLSLAASSEDYSLVALHGLLIVVASVIAEHGL